MSKALLLLAVLVLGGCASGMGATAGAVPAPPVDYGRGMVAAANPMAVEAGLRVLREGGSAVDAAVAVQAVLGLVEPQSSGLAGGAFMVVHDPRSGDVIAYDGRETVPTAAGPDLFLREDGAPLPFREAVDSGRAVGAPGVVAMLGMAQARHGHIGWNRLFEDAERLARDGFPVPARMANAAARDNRADIRDYIGGAKAGDVLKNPAYAQTVRKIANEGVRGFYLGPVAEAVVARAAQGPLPGALTLADISAYRAKASEAVCRPYRVYVVCAPGAPSGGPAVLMILGILENTRIDKEAGSADGWYALAEASRLMYADRDRYIADPDFVDVPVEGLLDRSYLKARAGLIGPVSEVRTAGTPPGARSKSEDETQEAAGTTHFVVVDARGMVVSVTSSVESSFGSGRMAAGMVLNNQLTDFSFTAKGPEGAPVANAVEGGKRPRSSMAPLIVFDRNMRFVAALGSPGGNSIPAYNAKALVGLLDWGMSLQQAIDLPNLIARGRATNGEAGKFDAGVLAGLAAKGVIVTPSGAEGSGLHGVAVMNGRLQGAADPRREGTARAP